MFSILAPTSKCNCPCNVISSPGRPRTFVPSMEYDGKYLNIFLDCEIHSARFDLLSIKAHRLSNHHYKINMKNYMVRSVELQKAQSIGSVIDKS